MIRQMVAAAMVVAMVMAATGCNDHEPKAPAREHRAIEIGAGVHAAALSRGIVESGPLEDYYTRIGVCAEKNNNGLQTVMEDYAVEYDGTSSQWGYEMTWEGTTQYLKYWDGSASRYDFYAFAPLTAGTAAGFDDDMNIVIPGLTGNSADSSDTDWVVAHLRREMAEPADYDILAIDNPLTAEVDETRTALTAWHDVVALKFHHVLSRIEFRIYSASTPVEIDLVQVYAQAPIYTKGNFSTATNYADYHSAGAVTGHSAPTSDAWEMAYAEEVTAPSLQPNALVIPGPHLEVPQTFADDGLPIEIMVTTKSGNTLQATGTLPGGWLPDTRYIYYIRLDDTKLILAEVDVLTYRWQEEMDVKQELNDW